VVLGSRSTPSAIFANQQYPRQNKRCIHFQADALITDALWSIETVASAVGAATVSFSNFANDPLGMLPFRDYFLQCFKLRDCHEYRRREFR
jgi:hypothetical protein